jgi:hypothetical protein
LFTVASLLGRFPSPPPPSRSPANLRLTLRGGESGEASLPSPPPPSSAENLGKLNQVSLALSSVNRSFLLCTRRGLAQMLGRCAKLEDLIKMGGSGFVETARFV